MLGQPIRTGAGIATWTDWLLAQHATLHGTPATTEVA